MANFGDIGKPLCHVFFLNPEDAGLCRGLVIKGAKESPEELFLVLGKQKVRGYLKRGNLALAKGKVQVLKIVSLKTAHEFWMRHDDLEVVAQRKL